MGGEGWGWLPGLISDSTLFIIWKIPLNKVYCIVLHCVVLSVLHNHYYTLLYCIIIVLYCIVLYFTVLYCIALYCVVLYCIVVVGAASFRRPYMLMNRRCRFCHN